MKAYKRLCDAARKKIGLFFLLTLSLTLRAKNSTRSQAIKQQVTVFVHGTMPPLVDKLVHAIDIPLGLTPALVQGNKYFQGRIPFTLSNADKQQFPIESFYLFGWSGDLSFKARKDAAYDLYHALKKLIRPITLITHSHGGNVALNLAAVAQEHNDTNFIIDRLILLAIPVQQATENYLISPVFKKVYSFYSGDDWTQVLDPQGIYTTSGITKEQQKNIFSGRLFKPASHLTQVRVFINRYYPNHIDFITKKFLTHMPFILTILKEFEQEAQIRHNEIHFDVFIPRCICQTYKIGFVGQAQKVELSRAH